jgi:transposase, IS5 family
LWGGKNVVYLFGYKQGKMTKQRKKRALVPDYLSPNQLTLEGFETPFEQSLNPKNRWVVLANLIPWDEVCNIYLKHVGVSTTGRPPINPRVVIGSVIIKHMCNLDDRETVDQISENVYMQYFLGYSSFTNQAPYDASLFVEFRKRLGMDQINAINERIMSLKANLEKSKTNIKEESSGEDSGIPNSNSGISASVSNNTEARDKESNPENKGRLLMDATACPQDIAYPTDLDLLSAAREKSEHLIDLLYDVELHKKKPRTYRRLARKRYLGMAQKKSKSRKSIRQAIGGQLRYLARNLRSIDKLLDAYDEIPLPRKEYRYLLIIHTVYQQQKQMYENRTHQVEHRIVSIHQPHVRPIVRGKANAKVEFGSKINVSLIDGISYLDEISWEAFNEGSHLMVYVENFKKRFGYYPAEVLVDQIYCTRKNRMALKLLGIRLIAKPLGRPPAVPIHVRPGERNPIEGKFGQAKTAYGLDRIRARLMGTSESMIASIILVLNLVRLAGMGALCLMVSVSRSFSAQWIKNIPFKDCLKNQRKILVVGTSNFFRLAA